MWVAAVRVLGPYLAVGPVHDHLSLRRRLSLLGCGLLRRRLHLVRARGLLSGKARVCDRGGDSGRGPVRCPPHRPGVRRILELAEAGRIDAAIAVTRDRFFRRRLHRLVLDEDLEEYDARLIALNDTGSKIADGVNDDVGEEERERTSIKTSTGKIEKARKGLMPGGNQVHFGFRFVGDTAEAYEVDEGKMALARRIFRMVGEEGRSLTAVKVAFDRDGIPTPKGKTYSVLR